MYYRLSLLNLIDPDWFDRSVLAIAFPIPPVPAKGIMYPIQNWNSNTLDRMEKSVLENSHAKMTEKGPAILRRYTLHELLGESYNDLVSPMAMYCATTSFIIRGTKEGIAEDVWIERMSRVSESCHRGSHMCVPRAPYLTSFLQMDHANGRGKPYEGFTFADDADGERYYPRTDFTANATVDRLFQYLTLQDAFELPYDKQAEWIRSEDHAYLTNRLLYLISGAVESNSYVFASTPDIKRAVAVIEKRNQLSSDQ